MNDADHNRRPIKARSSIWSKNAASFLAKTNISPNQISIISVFFAVIGAMFLIWYPTTIGLVICAAAIQGRLVCNLLDGMVAVEGGKKSPLGQIYNEFPDRIADSFLIIALGYAIQLPTIGWLGALASALTAYVRVFGGSLGLQQDFRGPMAKQHRMAIMTLACILGAIEERLWGSSYSLSIAAIIIAIGALITCFTRTQAIAVQLKARKN